MNKPHWQKQHELIRENAAVERRRDERRKPLPKFLNTAKRKKRSWTGVGK